MQHKSGLKAFVPALLGACLALSACGTSQEADEGPPTAKNSDEVVSVEVMRVQESSLQRSINAVGTIRYRRETPLGFTTSGRVASVRYNEGDFVKRGAVLAALDPQNTGADLAVARAEAQRARSEFNRIGDLYAQGWVTKRQFEATQAAATAADARVRQARYATGTSHIHAPSSGVVLSRMVEPGQVVSAGTPALLLGQNAQGFVFRAPVVDRDASKLRAGMPGLISIESLGSEPFQATISEIDGRANEATGAFNVIFRLPAQPRLRSGQIGTAQINLPAAQDGALQIPASALSGVRTGEGLVHIVGKDNRIETRNVRIERVLDNMVLVSGGVKLGDVIVTRGGETLRTGQKVRPIKAAADAAGEDADDTAAATTDADG